MGFWCYSSGAKLAIYSNYQHEGHTDLIYVSGSCGERFTHKILVEVIITRGFIQFYLEVIIVRTLFILFNAVTVRGLLLFDVINDCSISNQGWEKLIVIDIQLRYSLLFVHRMHWSLYFFE